MTPEELVTDTCPRIATLGAAFYFCPETLARGKELGLDGFRFYFLGRGGVLGDVDARVVQSAFGYFEANLAAKIWNSARDRAKGTPREVGRAYVGASQEFGRQYFAAVPGLERFCTAAETVVANTDPAGLTLFAALASEPLAADPPARAMQLVTVLPRAARQHPPAGRGGRGSRARGWLTTFAVRMTSPPSVTTRRTRRC